MNAQKVYQNLCAQLGDVIVQIEANEMKTSQLIERKEDILSSLRALRTSVEMEMSVQAAEKAAKEADPKP